MRGAEALLLESIQTEPANKSHAQPSVGDISAAAVNRETESKPDLEGDGADWHGGMSQHDPGLFHPQQG